MESPTVGDAVQYELLSSSSVSPAVHSINTCSTLTWLWDICNANECYFRDSVVLFLVEIRQKREFVNETAWL